jgi:predicted TIM-barrel fold metal-dependent hydrolase
MSNTEGTNVSTDNDLEIPWIISVDDHIQEPPTLWTDRLPRKYADTAPRVRREEVTYTNSKGVTSKRWGDVWYFADQRFELIMEYTAADAPADSFDGDPVTYDEIRPGTYIAADRLRDMDADHVEKSLGFPNGWVRFCGQRFLRGEDRELALLCVQAYNDFLVEEWSGPSDGRLLGVGIVPLWDGKLAADEVRRNAARGIRTVAFSELPSRLGLPSLYSGYWDDFVGACDETGTIICIHVGSSSATITSSDDAPIGVSSLCNFASSALSMSDWLISGVLPRHPNVKLMYSEAQAGWMPFVTGRLDRKWNEGYAAYGITREALPELPSTYFERQIFACVTDDPAALMFMDRFGADNICYETDYPHPDGSYPNSVAVARKLFGGLSAENIYKIVRGNAERLLAPARA